MLSSAFNDEFLQKLSSLKLIVKKILLSGVIGEKSFRQKGGKVEFSEYRDYSPGDETKHIDWNVFGRTEKLFVKEFAREESVNVYLIMDLTKSMDYNPRSNKFLFAKQLLAALSYIALVAGHRVKTIGFSNETITISPEFYREQDIFELMKHIDPLKADGRTNFDHILAEIDKETPSKGIIIFISDLMTQTDSLNPKEGFIRFINRGFEANLLNILSPEETDITLNGWIKLRDSETNDIKPVFVTRAIKNNYSQELNKFTEEWNSFCLQHNIRYFYIKADTPLETIVLDFLRRGGLLR
ncbi:MAG: DUF58 domain-containing protein [Planctomycetes bacterium]|nr:DUF58 domain-containing protein [Planctomycetota bacterium]